MYTTNISNISDLCLIKITDNIILLIWILSTNAKTTYNSTQQLIQPKNSNRTTSNRIVIMLAIKIKCIERSKITWK